MRHHDGEEVWEKVGHALLRLLDLVLDRLEATSLSLTTKEGPMANFPLNAGDSVVVTISDTDDVTGAAVTPDAGSVTAELSNTEDSVVVDPSGAFATLTAGATASTDNTLTVNATVNGNASKPGVGTYDVVVVTPPDATTVTLTFGTETAPTSVAAPVAAVATEAAGTFRTS